MTRPASRTGEEPPCPARLAHAVSTATDQVTANLPAGSLPASIGVTPDDCQVLVGNVLAGDATVIDPANGTVIGTILQGSGTSNLDAQPLGIAFTQS